VASFFYLLLTRDGKICAIRQPAAKKPCSEQKKRGPTFVLKNGVVRFPGLKCGQISIEKKS
jgi:hypothetical protein